MSYDRFGPYVIHECLGTGGMATVHRAELELEDGGMLGVALKRLLPQLADDRRLVDDFIREAKLASQLVHPNIARILEAGRIGKTYFIAMELVKGASLVSLLQRTHILRRTPPIGVVLAIGVELCDALDYAHEGTNDAGEPLRIVHRDLSPSNLLVTEDGHVKVIDFGVAKALAGNLQTNSGLAKGKLGYMSIEAISGKNVDTRADIYSAGIVLWELLTGRRLFRGKTDLDVLHKIQRGEIDPPSRYAPDCPIELDAVVMRALAKTADERWPSAAALRRELVRVRRFYTADATPEAIVSWVRALRPDTDEATEIASREDLELAEGSHQSEPIAEPAVVAPLQQRTMPKFVESDTVITHERLETDRED